MSWKNIFMFLILFLSFFVLANDTDAAWFAECSNSCTPIENGVRCDHWTGKTDYTNGCQSYRNTLVQNVRCQGNSVYGDNTYNHPDCEPKAESSNKPAPGQPAQPSCSNECSEGQKECVGNTDNKVVADFRIRECGKFDDDECLEMGDTNRYCDKVSKDTECQQVCGNTAALVEPSPDVARKQEEAAKPATPVQDIERPTKQAITKEAIQAPAQKINTDFNNNGCSDFNDYLEFAKNFGSASSSYDFDKNGNVDFSDFVNFAKTYEQTQCDTEQATATVEQIEKEIDCNVDPLKCYSVKRTNNQCDDLKLGEKCEVSWEIEINEKSLLNSQIGISPVFNYQNKNKERKENRINTALRILNDISGERRFALSTNSVLEITGNAVNSLNFGVNRIGRFECSLKTGNGVCCHQPFFKTSVQDPNKCVRVPSSTESGNILIQREIILKEIGDKMQRFLSTNDVKEKEELERELRELDEELRE